MKLLLTSAGVTNPTIHAALLELLGRPVEECTALAIPTAQYGHPWCSPESALRFTTGQGELPMVGLGWKSVGLLELTALPSVGAERWEPWVREADVVLVAGGEATYLAHWMRESGLADLLPSLGDDKVWVGLSAGSMVLTPRIGPEFVEWAGAPDDRTLGVVDFSIFPHLAPDGMPGNSMAEAEEWIARVGGPAYAIDDQTAISVVGGAVEVVSEGEWRDLS